jgi:hypothetical protein
LTTRIKGQRDLVALHGKPVILTWSIADLLAHFLDRPEFAPIRIYLATDDRGVRRIQLADQGTAQLWRCGRGIGERRAMNVVITEQLTRVGKLGDAAVTKGETPWRGSTISAARW